MKKFKFRFALPTSRILGVLASDCRIIFVSMPLLHLLEQAVPCCRGDAKLKMMS